MEFHSDRNGSILLFSILRKVQHSPIHKAIRSEYAYTFVYLDDYWMPLIYAK